MDSYSLFSHRDFTFRMQAILANHLAHDLSETDRQALFQAQADMQQYTLIGAIIGVPAVGLTTSFLLRRRLAKFAALGQLPPGGRPLYFGMTLLGCFSGGILGTDLGLMLGARHANKLITEQADPVRVSKAFRAASAEILREQASALEGTANSAVADKKVV